MALLLIVLGGLLSVAYGVWAYGDVMKRDAGTQRMQEIAGAIAFLASPDAAFITGVALPIEGGATLGYRRT